LLNAGAYKDNNVDVSLISHPGISPDAALVRTAAYSALRVEYFGKEAHAAARPWDGVSDFSHTICTTLTSYRSTHWTLSSLPTQHSRSYDNKHNQETSSKA